MSCGRFFVCIALLLQLQPWYQDREEPGNTGTQTMNLNPPLVLTELPAVIDPLVSIVMPCLRQLDYTKVCIASVLKYSRHPFELISLDIGSFDHTADYLEGMETGARFRVENVR